ncbi:MAG TPA: family 1 encapsulin nanocompartment shell protein [Prolixibacteraceae bacterium]|nr:family 1 encapsulin nanocompartment shell protein [Prolixibacteraceae bacterium]
MNILKKSIAPITDKAWKEISEQTKAILNTYLTARKFVDIDGPNGLELGGVSTGRLNTPEHQSHKKVNYGVREMLPLVELRKPFELDIWELDNIERGAKNVDLEPLEEAVKEIAEFEEMAIYEGFTPANIKGLTESAESSPVTIPQSTNAFLKEIGHQVIKLKRNAVEGPYTLVISEPEWLEMVKLSEGYPVQKQLQEILGGKVLISPLSKKSFLVSERGGDYELIIGQDITLGYDSHDTKSVKLYLTSSFTFRVLSPEAIVVFNREQNE